MSTSTITGPSRPYGLFALMAIAAVLYVLMFVNALTPLGDGEAAFSDAYEAFLVVAGLWIVLTIMLFVGGIMGAMPGWAAAAWIVLIPLSGVAAFVAMDMCSRKMPGAVVFPALLALAIAFYACWARSTRLHKAMPPRQTSLLTLGAVLVLSIAPMLAATVY